MHEPIKSDGSLKFRSVDAAMWVNAHLADMSFRMETLARTIPEVVQRYDHMFAFDVVQAYYELHMCPEAIPWLHSGKNTPKSVTFMATWNFSAVISPIFLKPSANESLGNFRFTLLKKKIIFYFFQYF